ncbi:hypothetical protein [Actinokineospora iranica]|uniref:Uncharacterized protein n=1 Tax=Actinokineospora iranica TaxID=1271860 RepID=A0A1G6WS06_9PSEU|nr:hypothetical protein [Actinokineospora iranica]SDD68453.1 hypothetical protein SAMN05216174_115138 [Actinokineospora iranica]
MSVTRIPNPVGTRLLCPNGCGLLTVEAELHGQVVRVHCGTFSPSCPTTAAAAVPAQRRAA